MKKYLLLFCFLCVVTLVPGCSTTLYTSTNEETSYGATDASNITVTTNDYSEQDYSEIGFITTTQTDLLAAKKELKEYAARMGGNAILNFKVTVIRTYIYIIFIPIPIDNYVCRGTVIKYV